jgi:hypothetical protein
MIKISDFPRGRLYFANFRVIARKFPPRNDPSSHFFPSLSSGHSEESFTSPILSELNYFESIVEEHVVQGQRYLYKERARRTFSLLTGNRRQRICLLLRYFNSFLLLNPSGQIPADSTGALVDGDIKAHTVNHLRKFLIVETMSRKFERRSRGGWIEHQFCCQGKCIPCGYEGLCGHE